MRIRDKGCVFLGGPDGAQASACFPGLCVLPDGRWLVAFRAAPCKVDTPPQRVLVTWSDDEGQNWAPTIEPFAPKEVDGTPGAWRGGQPSSLGEQRVAMVRNIHVRTSPDSGRTWGRLWDTGVPGQPAAPVPLSDSNIALVYVDRDDGPTIKVRVSSDDGRTWPEASERVIAGELGSRSAEAGSDMTKAWDTMEQFSLGLPVTAKLADGDILVAYYTGATPDHTAISWVRLGP